MKMRTTADRITLDALRAEVRRLLEQCTDGQRAFFDKICPDLNAMTPKNLGDLIALCERTIKRNAAKQENP